MHSIHDAADDIERELTVLYLLYYASRYHADTEIVSYFLNASAENRKQNEQHIYYDDMICQRYTYSTFYQRVCQLSQLLQTLIYSRDNIVSMKPKQPTIALLATTSSRGLEVCYATMCSGFIFLPLNPKMEKESLKYIVRHSQPTVGFYERCFRPVVQSVVGEDTIKWICFEDEYETMIDTFEYTSVRWKPLDEHRFAMVCYTSGMTSKPRGMMYTHRQIILSCLSSISPDGVGLASSDNVLILLGFHSCCCWNLVFMSLMVGAKCVFLDEYCIHDSFFDSFCTIVQKEKITLSANIPTFWGYMLDYLRKNHYELRIQDLPLEKILTGGSSIYPLLYSQYKQFHISLVSMYGLVETQYTGFYSSLKNCVKRSDTNDVIDLFLDRFRPLFGMDVKVDDEDHMWKDGEQGEIYLKGLWTPRGIREPGKLITVNDWFPSGDVGYMSEDGFLTILEKKKDIVKLNGVWVSSIQLENIVLNHPNVLQAACVSIYEEVLGELCVLVVKPKEPMLETDIIKLYVDRSFCPSYILFTEMMPMTNHNKVDKESVKQLVYDVLIGLKN